MSSANKKLLGTRWRERRENLGLSQTELAKILGVSKSTISLIEGGKNHPSETLLKLFLAYFVVEQETFLAGIDLKFLASWEEKSKAIFSPILVATSGLALANPLVAASIATTAGAATLVLRLCDAFKVTNEKELCDKLGVGASTISSWKKRDSIPKHHLLKAAAATGKNIDWFYKPDDHDMDFLTELILRVNTKINEQRPDITEEKKARLLSYLIKTLEPLGEIDDTKIEDAAKLV